MKRMLLLLLFFATRGYGYIDLPQKKIVIDKVLTAVTLSNKGDRTEYVQIAMSRILNPGVELENERRSPISDAADPAIFAFPLKLTLAPGQSKVFYIKRLKKVDREQVYRIAVEPLLNPSVKEQGVGIILNVSYFGLVRLLPAEQRATFSVSCDDKGGTVTATGTVRFTVSDANLAGKKIESFNVYPELPHRFIGKSLSFDGKTYCSD